MEETKDSASCINPIDWGDPCEGCQWEKAWAILMVQNHSTYKLFGIMLKKIAYWYPDVCVMLVHYKF
jgi:hypothetical protein